LIFISALSSRIIERIFSGCVTRAKNRNNITEGNKMSYTEFVYFLLSEEDKNCPTSIEYWFRCMDIDGDGVLSMYEMEYFYEEQQHRMEQLGKLKEQLLVFDYLIFFIKQE
jgi:serine/threonine-protein phosphatase 2A regulatory subunit B''